MSLQIHAVPKSKRIEQIREGLNRNIHPNLPQIPFVVGLVASKGSGKSTIIYNLLHNPSFYYQRFHQVWVFSPTIHLDDTYRMAKFNQERLISDVDTFEDTFRKITESIDKSIAAITNAVSRNKQLSEEAIREEVEVQKYKQLDQILVIIDDSVGVKGLAHGIIPNMFSRHRHYFISFLYAVQIYKAMPPVMRVNLNAIILFRILNRAELKKVVEEQATRVNDKEWLRLYNEATKDSKYDFFYINIKNPDCPFYKNFDTPLPFVEYDGKATA